MSTHEDAMERLEEKLARMKRDKPPENVYLDDDTGVKVRGPYHRLRKRAMKISSFYNVTYHDPPHLRDAAHRTTEQRKTQTAARHRGREIKKNIEAGARADAAPNRGELVRELVAEYLDPANHRKGSRDGRPVGWDSARTVDNNRNTMHNWVVPLIGDLRCEQLGTKVTYQDGDWVPSPSGQLPIDHVLGRMELAGQKASTRNTHFSHISGLVTHGRDRGWIPPSCDPLGGVTRPVVNKKRTDLPDKWIDPETEVPTRLAIDVLSEVYRTRHTRRSHWSEEYSWRWAQMPRVVAHTGARLMTFLGWRACDWVLESEVPHVRIPEQLDRETDDEGLQQRRLPKHGSVRTVEVVPWLVDDMRELKRMAMEAGGPMAPIWPALSDPTKHVRYDSFSSSYFHPQAQEAHRRMVEMAKQDPSIRVCWSHEVVPQWQQPGVPKVNKHGEQVVRREFEHTPKSLRHYFATWALAPHSAGGLDAGIKTVQRWMGHSSPQVTWDMYLAHEPGEVQRILERAEKDERATDVRLYGASDTSSDDGQIDDEHGGDDLAA